MPILKKAGEGPLYEVSEPDQDGKRTVTRTDPNGSSAVIALFLGPTQTIEFTAERYTIYRLPIMRQLGELGLRFKTMRIKGAEVDKIDPSAPTRPKQDSRQGDKTPVYVDWMFKVNPKEAKIVYDVLGYATQRIPATDSAGRLRYDQVTGAQLFVTREHVLIARRKTHLTELPNGTEVYEAGQEPEEMEDA